MSSRLRLHQSSKGQMLGTRRSEDRQRVLARNSPVCRPLDQQRNHCVWSLVLQPLTRKHNWSASDLGPSDQSQKDPNHAAASQKVRYAATTALNAQITAARHMTLYQIFTSNLTLSKPTAPLRQYQYPRHPQHIRGPFHNTLARALVATLCTTTPLSKNPKQKTKASKHPLLSPLRLHYPTRSSHPADTPPDHDTSAHNHGVPLCRVCVRSASKSTRQRTRGM